MGRILDLWFRPKWFESKGLYEKLGVRIFKKFIPNSGDLVLRWAWRRYRFAEIQRSLESLESWELTTRNLEVIHILGFLVFSVMSLLEISLGNWRGFFCWLTTNILINVYPVLLQRYNRLRIYNAISKMRPRSTPLAP